MGVATDMLMWVRVTVVVSEFEEDEMLRQRATTLVFAEFVLALSCARLRAALTDLKDTPNTGGGRFYPGQHDRSHER